MFSVPARITGKFPGYLSPSAGLKFADVPNGLAAISKVPAAGWGQILAYMAFCEVSQDQSPGTPAAAGDFGFKVLTSSDPAEKTKKLSAELANGRLAMMAIIGMFFQDKAYGCCHAFCCCVCICMFKLMLVVWLPLLMQVKASYSWMCICRKFMCFGMCWYCVFVSVLDEGRPDRKRVGRLGQLHGIASACAVSCTRLNAARLYYNIL